MCGGGQGSWKSLLELLGRLKLGLEGLGGESWVKMGKRSPGRRNSQCTYWEAGKNFVFCSQESESRPDLRDHKVRSMGGTSQPGKADRDLVAQGHSQETMQR